MAIIRWYDRPSAYGSLREMEDLRQEMNRLFSSFFGKSGPWPRQGVYPALNVTEKENVIVVRGELPGIRAEDMEITVEGETLTLKGERKLQDPEGVSYHRREREAGRFRRIVNLPARIDAEAVEASFQNGVLTIKLPKAKEALPKQVTVKSGS